MQTADDKETEQATFPMRVAARLTGVAPERMRAWESRHAAIQPVRSEGGTRRYSLSDLERLKLLRRAIEAGHRIGEVAHFDLSQLRACLPEWNTEAGTGGRFSEILEAIKGLDAQAVRRILEVQRAQVGVVDFAKDYLLALVFEIGRLWEIGEISIASEHLATAIARSMLINALDAEVERATGPAIVFATPTEERHDLGLLVAALIARRAEARIIFLGAEIPESDLVECIRTSRAEVLVLGFVMSNRERVVAILRSVRRELPDSVALWIGGSAIKGCGPIRGVERIENLDQLAAYVLDVKTRGRADSKRAMNLSPELSSAN